MATTNPVGGAASDASLADEYLSDLVYGAMLERGEASKISEITLEINNPRITVPAVRVALTGSPRFMTIDRMWDLKSRYMDKSRPAEGALDAVLEAAGRPLSVVQLATELSIIYNRPSDVYLQSIPRTVRIEPKYFRTNKNEFGLTKWLPLTDGENEKEVIEDNKLNMALVTSFRSASQKVGWAADKYSEATYRLVSAAKRPVSHKLIGVLAFLVMGEKYDGRAHFAACIADNRLVWVTARNGGGRWITTAYATRLEGLIEEKAATLTAEEPEEIAPPAPVVAPPAPQTALVADAEPETPIESVAAPEPAPQIPQPLEITEADLKAIEAILTERAAPTEASELLGLRYEVLPGDPSYRSDVQTLEERLKTDARFLYVGASRFREPNSLPLFVYAIPEYLAFPELQFISMDGEIMDEEIEDEGFAGTLKIDMQQPLAQDAGDDENHYTGEASAEEASLRLVVKAHHKDIGTFPLCQVPDGFFPKDAAVVEITVRDPAGEAHNVVINHEIRLAFNLFGLYEFLGADSGSVFRLHKMARAYEFRFEPLEEIDAQVGVAAPRIAELQNLKEQAEGGDLATFDLACEVLESQPKGLDFVQLMTEVNLVRRVTRRKLASILSNYFCFVQKPGQPQWRFDARKRDLGTDRAKRKYIKR